MPPPDIVARRIGREGQPVAIVDGLTEDPHALRDAACAAAFGPAGAHYPGIRADLPPDYLPGIRDVVALVLDRIFGLRRSARVLDASFSMVTCSPDALTVEQRMPHIDATMPGRIAMVHYLSPANPGGTAFYRHCATGLETIGPDQASAYLAIVGREVRSNGPPPARYPGPGDAQFTQIDAVAAQFNRAIFYRSALLHSGVIDDRYPLSVDPATGRLTVTAFFDAD